VQSEGTRLAPCQSPEWLCGGGPPFERGNRSLGTGWVRGVTDDSEYARRDVIEPL
jgi:hypothetical protein